MTPAQVVPTLGASLAITHVLLALLGLAPEDRPAGFVEHALPGVIREWRAFLAISMDG